ITAPMRAGEPVVTSTNQGNATAAISDPVVEMTSAENRATKARRFGAATTARSVCPAGRGEAKLFLRLVRCGHVPWHYSVKPRRRAGLQWLRCSSSDGELRAGSPA